MNYSKKNQKLEFLVVLGVLSSFDNTVIFIRLAHHAQLTSLGPEKYHILKSYNREVLNDWIYQDNISL